MQTCLCESPASLYVGDSSNPLDLSLMKTISAEQLHSLHRAQPDLTLIDVRSPAEFRTVHVQSAINVPLGDLSADALAPHARMDDAVYLICHSGGRSAQAGARLKSLGFTNVFSVDGGTVACRQCGVPVNHGPATMSLERQVRIVAGSLVLVGVLLSLFVQPAFIYLSGFVGAGLVFAGISDTCLMGLLLAKMPWNR
ncbi:rhodanese-like domain-containing protein [Horticoccus luteus]|uniref:Rhodanese-like domain-containing protein n=1 Tax=Horticoccus luteus TaxID=2862869 RepID=A0A8F9XFM2_9BACT|nr:rhodanese-like domain-containing protein [Horticoccus luteus]QYM78247.1 rhodanese-like domain-containing protein [Horticoccus luteus]